MKADSEKAGKNKSLLIGGITLVIIILAIVGLFMKSQSSGNAAPGEAPEGKVWSPEHGHWHDVE